MESKKNTLIEMFRQELKKQNSNSNPQPVCVTFKPQTNSGYRDISWNAL